MGKLYGQTWTIGSHDSLTLSHDYDLKIISAQLSNTSNTESTDFVVCMRSKMFLNNTDLPFSSIFHLITEDCPQVINVGDTLTIRNLGSTDIILHMSYEDNVNDDPINFGGFHPYERKLDPYEMSNILERKIKELEDQIAELDDLEQFYGELPEFLSNSLVKKRMELMKLKGEI